MKYHLDTIPVWDAYHEEKECALCALKEKAEKSYIESFLGGSVMEPDTRIAVNEKGFCAIHNDLLYKAQNRLGLALMTHSHTLLTIEKMNKHIEIIEKGFKASNSKSIFKSKKGDTPKTALKEFSKWLTEHTKSCIICDRMDYTIKRYTYTILHLWENEKKFNDAFKESKGFCFKHLPIFIDMAIENLSERQLKELILNLLDIESRNIDRQEKELLWFTQKFDYRNNDKPWENSKDALPRLLQRLTGKNFDNK